MWSGSDPRTWELAAPTIDASSSLCLPHSTNLWQSSEEEAMSWFLHYHSHHPLNYKINVIKNLVHRGITLAHKNFHKENIQKI